MAISSLGSRNEVGAQVEMVSIASTTNDSSFRNIGSALRCHRAKFRTSWSSPAISQAVARDLPVAVSLCPFLAGLRRQDLEAIRDTSYRLFPDAFRSNPTNPHSPIQVSGGGLSGPWAHCQGTGILSRASLQAIDRQGSGFDREPSLVPRYYPSPKTGAELSLQGNPRVSRDMQFERESCFSICASMVPQFSFCNLRLFQAGLRNRRPRTFY